MVEHAGVWDRFLWLREAYPLTGTDRVLQITPLSFDISLTEIFWPLSLGATLVLAEPGGQRDPAYLIRLIQEERLTGLQFVPSALPVLLEARGIEMCDSPHRVFCIGEPLPFSLQERFYRRLGGVAKWTWLSARPSPAGRGERPRT